jgi:nucleosome assembly protein 1-like 1
MSNRRNRRQNDNDADNFDAEDEDNDSDNDSEDDELAHLPRYVIPRVEKLQQLHQEREKIMEQYLLDRAALEKKYGSLLKPLYEERASIVVGKKDDEIAIESQKNSVENSTVSPEEGSTEEPSTVKGIPQFWACTMARMEAIGEIISEDDVDCLEHLVDIKCIDRDDGKGFSLEFYFTPNDYFTNNVLTKEYQVPNLLLSDEPVLKNVKGTKIDWKKDRCLTVRTVKKKQRGKGKNAGQVRTVEKTEEKDSFFSWFSPPEMPAMDELDEEEAERLEEIFDSDFEVASTFRTEVIPKAIVWFTNQANDEEMQAVIEAAIERDARANDDE